MAEKKQQTSEPEEQPTQQPLPRSYGMEIGAPSNTTSKVEWPELVGLTAEEAESKIKQEAKAGLQVHVIPANSFVTMDFRQDRVRLFVDADGKIARAPTIG